MLRRFSNICLFLLTLSFASFAEEANSSNNSQNEKLQKEIEEALPVWLARTSFQVKDRLVLRFDGSEEAGGILRSSESWNRVLFKDAENWRALREYPFTHSSREVLSLKGEHFVLTSRNRKIPAAKDLSPAHWIEVVLSPYRMAKEMGFNISESSFASWIEKIQELKEPLTTDNGGKLRVEKTETAKTKSIRIVVEGFYFHDAKTKVQVLEEWNLEYDIPVTAKDLEASLIGGSS